MSEIKDSFYNMPAGCHRADGLTDDDDQEQAIREKADFAVRVQERFGDWIDVTVQLAINLDNQGFDLDDFEAELLKRYRKAGADEVASQMRGGTI